MDSMDSMEEIWFNDTPKWMDSTTISQFLDAIEGNEDWRDDFKKAYALSHLKGPAQEFAIQNLFKDMNWNDVKLKLFEHFKCQLSIWEKLEMKRNLKQNGNETIKNFYNRCVSYQYLFCDDFSETVLDSEIMLNFMLGMNGKILDTMHQRFSALELDLKSCLSQTVKIELEMPIEEIPKVLSNEKSATLEQPNFVDVNHLATNGHQAENQTLKLNPSDCTFKKEPQFFAAVSTDNWGVPKPSSGGRTEHQNPHPSFVNPKSKDNQTFKINHSEGTFKEEPQFFAAANSDNWGVPKIPLGGRPEHQNHYQSFVNPILNQKAAKIASPSRANSETPVKKVLKNFNTPTKKIKAEFGTPSKLFLNDDFGASSNVDGNITKSADGPVCNVCGKIFSKMSNARRHYKTTHEVNM